MQYKIKPVFIHSNFRAASTYLWSQFRKAPNSYTYYEPFNPGLISMTHESLAQVSSGSWDSQHPQTALPYFTEFLPLLRSSGGVLNYPRSLIGGFLKGSDVSLLHKYLDQLIRFPQDLERIPVLCFCRSLSLVQWVKKTFGGLHITSLRNPYSQWVSFLRQNEIGNLYFTKAILDFLNTLLSTPYDIILKDIDFNVQPEHYASHIDRFADIFLIYYFISTSLSTENADIILNVDQISKNKKIGANIEKSIMEMSGLDGLSFQDCCVPLHEQGDHFSIFSESAYKLMSIKDKLADVSFKAGVVNRWSDTFRIIYDDIHREEANNIQQSEVLELNSTIHQRTKEIEFLKGSSEAKDFRIKDLKDENAKDKALIRTLRLSKQEDENVISSLGKKLQQREEKNQLLSQKIIELNTLNEELVKKNVHFEQTAEILNRSVEQQNNFFQELRIVIKNFGALQGGLEMQLEGANAYYQSLHARNADLEAQLADANVSYQSLQSENVDLMAQVANNISVIQSLQDTIDFQKTWGESVLQKVSELDIRLSAVYNSLSWKITSPARAVLRLLLKFVRLGDRKEAMVTSQIANPPTSAPSLTSPVIHPSRTSSFSRLKQDSPATEQILMNEISKWS